MPTGILLCVPQVQLFLFASGVQATWPFDMIGFRDVVLQAREASLQRKTSDRVADLLPKLAVLMENAEARINS